VTLILTTDQYSDKGSFRKDKGKLTYRMSDPMI
jgi:hypothetical protein